MTQETITTANGSYVRITAADGYRLTQAADVDDEQRFFFQIGALAVNDSADNYTEWTADAADTFLTEREAQRQAEEAAQTDTTDNDL